MQVLLKLGIDDHGVEVGPDALVLSAVEHAARGGSLIIDAASASGLVVVHAVARRVLTVPVRMPEIPLHDAFFDILPSERKTVGAASGLAQVDSLRAVNLRQIGQHVLVLPRVVEVQPQGFLSSPLPQLGDHRRTPLAEGLFIYATDLDEQLRESECCRGAGERLTRRLAHEAVIEHETELDLSPLR